MTIQMVIKRFFYVCQTFVTFRFMLIFHISFFFCDTFRSGDYRMWNIP